jgi:Asp-tRNA(Asn)/Glu-tRNA(Gln) amidotransferase A subunit family amidase
MARSVGDTAMLLAAMVGLDRRDPLSYPAAAVEFWPMPSVDLAGLRVGWTEDFGVCAVDADIRGVLRRRIAAIAPWFACCEPIDAALGDVDRAFDIVRAESFVAAFADTYRSAPETLGPNVRANVEMATSITLADRAWAHLEQTRIARRMQSLFERYDLLLAPVTPVSPFPWTELYAHEVDGQTMRNYYQWLALTYAVTLATNPALALPCGRDERGMPFGLQIVAPLRGEARLLGASQALEQAFAGHAELARPRPDLLALQTPRPELTSIVTHPALRGGAADSATGMNAV